MGFVNKINAWLRRYPMIKRVIKRVYQLFFYVMSPRQKPNEQIRVLAESEADSFFGYYDKCPWDSSQRYVVYVSAKDMHKNVCAQTACDIILLDTTTQEKQIIARSRTCNTQQGCMLQWRGPLYDKEIIYNDFIDNSYKSVILNVFTLEKKVIDLPVYAVSPDGEFAFTLDFARLHRLRPGYGYGNQDNATKKKACPEEPSILKINLATNEASAILTYSQLAVFDHRREMAGAEHKVNHIMISPNGKRVMFLHRWLLNGKKYSRLVTCDCDGGNLYNLLDDDMVSHCNWIDDETIISFARKKEYGNGYFILKDQSKQVSPVFQSLTQDGHPSLSPDKEHIITDTYPDKSRQQHLYLCNLRTNGVKKIASVFADFKYDNDTRCDLHPRFSRDGKRICFDAVFEGKRKVYEMSLDLS